MKLNGYWQSKADPTHTVYVERVYRTGKVTGFSYFKRDGKEIIGEFRSTHGELLERFKRRDVTLR